MMADDKISTVIDRDTAEIILILIVVILGFFAPVHRHDNDLRPLFPDSIDEKIMENS